MDKCYLHKCHRDSWNLFEMVSGPYLLIFVKMGSVTAKMGWWFGVKINFAGCPVPTLDGKSTTDLVELLLSLRCLRVLTIVSVI